MLQMVRGVTNLVVDQKVKKDQNPQHVGQLLELVKNEAVASLGVKNLQGVKSEKDKFKITKRRNRLQT